MQLQFYAGLVLAAFAITFAVMIPFIGLMFKLKFVRGKETEEVRKGATANFYRIRQLHASKTGKLLTAGGIPVVVVATAMFAFIYWLLGEKAPVSFFPLGWELAVLFFTFISFALLGLYDDIIKVFGFARTGFFGLRMRHKFIIQWILALVAAGILYFGLGINFVNIPFLGIVRLGWGYFPLAAFMIVAFTNAFDITDGLDGLSGGLLMICLLAFWLIGVGNLDHVMTTFIALWLGSLIAYLYFNIWPARIMLGNAGGLAFGATLAVLGLLTGKIVAMMVISGIFLIEGASSLLQLFSKRFMKKRMFPIAPLHHWLQLAGWEEPKIVARAWMMGLVAAIFGLWLAVL